MWWPPGAAVAGGTVIVVQAGAAEIEFGEFRAVRVPLEHHRLGPVVPERCGQRVVARDQQVAARDLVDRTERRHARQSVRTRQAVGEPVVLRERDRARQIEAFMDRQPARIGLVAVKRAPRRGAEGLRQMRAGGAVVEHGRKHAGFDAARDRRGVGRIDQALGQQLGHDRLLVRGREIGAVPDAGVGIEERVERLRLERRILHQPDGQPVAQQGRLHQRRRGRDAGGERVAGARQRLVVGSDAGGRGQSESEGEQGGLHPALLLVVAGANITPSRRTIVTL